MPGLPGDDHHAKIKYVIIKPSLRNPALHLHAFRAELVNQTRDFALIVDLSHCS